MNVDSRQATVFTLYCIALLHLWSRVLVLIRIFSINVYLSSWSYNETVPNLNYRLI